MVESNLSADRQDRFDTTHLHADLKGRTIRGGIATLVAQVFSFALNLVSVAVLARLLTPGDFGLVAMVTAVTGVIAMFKDSGLSAATIQHDTVTHEQVSTLFWVNLGLAVGLAACIAASAPAIAWFYSEPRLLFITLAVAAIFVLDGPVIQHQALLRRQMRFGALARIQVLSSSLALVVAVAVAIRGAGYWTLIVQVAVQQAAGTVLTWSYCRWVPGLPRRAAGTRTMLAFGGYLTGFSFVNYFARNADNVLIGNVWGSSSLGLYSKAYGLLTLPLQQINGPVSAVAIPSLSRLQNDPEKFRELFRQVLSVISFLSFPLIAWMIICRREIVLLILGPQWVGAIPIFGLLAMSAFVQPVGNITGVLYIALGRTKRMFRWGLIGCSWLVASFFVGIRFGAFGVAAAYSVAMLLMIVPLIGYAIAGTCVGWRDFYDGIKFQVLATAGIAVLGLLARNAYEDDGTLWKTLAATTVAMCVGYFAIFLTTKPSQLRLFVSFIKARRRVVTTPKEGMKN